MKPQRPSYWQLDLFVCGMIALGIILIQDHIGHQWERLVDTGWAAIAIVGMTIWVWANWSALCDEDHRQRNSLKHERAEPRHPKTPAQSLTPVQHHFLDAMHRNSRR